MSNSEILPQLPAETTLNQENAIFHSLFGADSSELLLTPMPARRFYSTYGAYNNVDRWENIVLRMIATLPRYSTGPGDNAATSQSVFVQNALRYFHPSVWDQPQISDRIKRNAADFDLIQGSLAQSFWMSSAAIAAGRVVEGQAYLSQGPTGIAAAMELERAVVNYASETALQIRNALKLQPNLPAATTARLGAVSEFTSAVFTVNALVGVAQFSIAMDKLDKDFAGLNINDPAYDAKKNDYETKRAYYAIQIANASLGALTNLLKGIDAAYVYKLFLLNPTGAAVNTLPPATQAAITKYKGRRPALPRAATAVGALQATVLALSSIPYLVTDSPNVSTEYKTALAVDLGLQVGAGILGVGGTWYLAKAATAGTSKLIPGGALFAAGMLTAVSATQFYVANEWTKIGNDLKSMGTQYSDLGYDGDAVLGNLFTGHADQTRALEYTNMAVQAVSAALSFGGIPGMLAGAAVSLFGFAFTSAYRAIETNRLLAAARKHIETQPGGSEGYYLRGLESRYLAHQDDLATLARAALADHGVLSVTTISQFTPDEAIRQLVLETQTRLGSAAAGKIFFATYTGTGNGFTRNESNSTASLLESAIKIAPPPANSPFIRSDSRTIDPVSRLVVLSTPVLSPNTSTLTLNTGSPDASLDPSIGWTIRDSDIPDASGHLPVDTVIANTTIDVTNLVQFFLPKDNPTALHQITTTIETGLGDNTIYADAGPLIVSAGTGFDKVSYGRMATTNPAGQSIKANISSTRISVVKTVPGASVYIAQSASQSTVVSGKTVSEQYVQVSVGTRDVKTVDLLQQVDMLLGTPGDDTFTVESAWSGILGGSMGTDTYSVLNPNAIGSNSPTLSLDYGAGITSINATLGPQGGTVTKAGSGTTTANDTINGRIVLLSGSNGNDTLSATVSPPSSAIDPTNKQGFTLLGQGGDDTIIGSNLNDVLDGGSGNDTLIASAGDDWLTGGDGNDFLSGGDGNDTLYGDAGDDVIDGAAGEDLIDGGDGYDTVSYANSTEGVYIDLNEGRIAPVDLSALLGSQVVKINTSLDSALNGTSLDTLFQSPSWTNRTPTKNSSNAPASWLELDLGQLCITTQIIVRALSWIGNGTSKTYFGPSFLDGITAELFDADHKSLGMITAATSASSDNRATNYTFDTREAVCRYIRFKDDSNFAVVSGITVMGSNDASTEAVQILGDASGDILRNVEKVIGSSLDDYFVSTPQANAFDGGTGRDTVSYAVAAKAVNVNLALTVQVDRATDGSTNNPDSNGDVLTSIENVLGTVRSDVIQGNDQNNTLDGNGNDGGSGFGDKLFGMGGDDLLHSLHDSYKGQSYLDTLDGGAGNDTVSYLDFAQGVRVVLGPLGSNATGYTEFASTDAKKVEAIQNLISIENVIGSKNDDFFVPVESGPSKTIRIDGGDRPDQNGLTIHGIDTVSYLSFTAGVSVDLSSQTPTQAAVQASSYNGLANPAGGEQLINIDNLDGSNFADKLTGDGNANVLTGNDGNDELNGGAGGDTLTGGKGSDTLNGGAGDDTLLGGDTLEYLQTPLDNPPTDLVLDSSSYDQLYGGDGNDKLFGGNGTNLLDGGAGDDILIGANQVDNLTGGDGSDWLTGYGGNDTLSGGNGNDTLIGGAGADVLSGSAGFDVAGYDDSSAGVQVSLVPDVTGYGGDAQGDTLTGIEGLVGSAYDDVFTADVNANYLDGGFGTDELRYSNSQSGVTVNLSNQGLQRLDQWLTRSDAPSQLTRSLIAGTNPGVTFDLGKQYILHDIKIPSQGLASKLTQVTVSISNDPNNLYQTSFTATLNPQVDSNLQDILLQVNANTQARYVTLVLSGPLASSVDRTALKIQIDGALPQAGGDAQGDELRNFESVTGSAFVDTLTGNDDSNVLTGGGGNDTLAGGAGDDTYVFNIGDGNDNIIENNNDYNTIQFGTGITKANIRASYSGTSNNLTLNVSSADGTANWGSITFKVPEFWTAAANYNLKTPIQNIRFSDGTSFSLAEALKNNLAAQVTGMKTQGQVLTSSVQEQNGTALQWESSNDGVRWTPIFGATHTNYALGQSDVGRQIRVVAMSAVTPTTSGFIDFQVSPTTPPSNSTNLVVNGDFSQALSQGEHQAPNSWTVIGNGVGASQLNYGAEARSVVALHAWGDSNGGKLQQAITTIPGHTYVLTFNMGAVWNSGGPTGPGVCDARLRIQAAAGSNTIFETLAANTLVTKPTSLSEAFSAYTYTFTATSASTILSFADESATSQAIDIFLGDVTLRELPNAVLNANNLPSGVPSATGTLRQGAKLSAGLGSLADVDGLGNLANAAQPTGPASPNLNGSASQVDSGIYRLTNATNQAGSLWNAVDLSRDLTVNAKLYFGANGASDADGIAFAFQNQGSNALGGQNGNLGVGGLASSFGVKFDTWGNTTLNEPASGDFVRFFKNGGTLGGVDNSFDGFQYLNDILPNGAWHDLVVNWNAARKTLSYTLDGMTSGTKSYDVVAKDWGNNAIGWFGFTGGTGGALTTQQVQILSAVQQPSLPTAAATTPLNLTGGASLIKDAYQLTPNAANQSGAIWGDVDLSKNLTVKAKLYFGANDNGADGLSFFLQSRGGTVSGGNRSGLTTGGGATAFGIAFDTYANTGEPNSDFVDFFKQGQINNFTFDPARALSNNIEDGQWHNITVNWNAASKSLSYTLDGGARYAKTYDVVSQDWGDNPLGYFGFGAKTGGAFNSQQVLIVSVRQSPYMWQSSSDEGVTWSDAASGTDWTPDATTQAGQKIRLQANYVDGFGTLESVSGANLGSLAANNFPTGSVNISGRNTQNSTLTAGSSIDDADGMGTMSYQWQSSQDGGETWQAVSSANGATLSLNNELVGRQIRVVAEYLDGHGVAESVTSQPVQGSATLIVNGSFDTLKNGDQGPGIAPASWDAFGDVGVSAYFQQDPALKQIVFKRQDSKAPGGHISQQFATNPGQTYSVTFTAAVDGLNANDKIRLHVQTIGAALPPISSVSVATLVDNPTVGLAYQLTNSAAQAGAIWSAADLSKNLLVKAKLFFDGAGSSDGIVFALQNQGANALGGTNGSLGISGVTSAFGLKFDTYQNPGEPTPSVSGRDILQFFRNGQAIASNTSFDGNYAQADLNNGQWHDVTLSWSAATKTLSYTLDNGNIVSKTYDVVATDWGGNPNGWFGFTAGSGTPGTQLVQIVSTQQTFDAAPTSSTYSPYSFNFTATDTTTWLGFTDESSLVSPTTTAIRLDNVEVTAVLPNLVQNGSFELGINGLGQNIVPSGWTLDANNVGVTNEPLRVTDGRHGMFFHAWNALSGGSISQTLNTEVGKTYILSFDMSNEIWGQPTPPATTDRLNVQALSGGNVVLDVIAVDATPTAPGSGASRYTYTFTAASTQTTLRFTDTSVFTSNPGTDMMLDNIVVRQLSSATIANTNHATVGAITINGVPAIGNTLTAVQTLTDVDGIGALNYQWQAYDVSQAAWVNIENATLASYIVSGVDAGAQIRITANYVDGRSTRETPASAPVSIANLNQSPTGNVLIAGLGLQNQTLSASNTLSDPDGIKGAIVYQWESSSNATTWTPITGAAASSFKLTQAQVGQFVRVVASYIDGNNNATSVPSSPVLAPSTNAADNRLANPSFEMGVGSSPTSIPSWSSINASVIHGNSLASNGSQVVELSAGGLLSQVIDTVSGTTYSLRFDFAGRLPTNSASQSTIDTKFVVAAIDNTSLVRVLDQTILDPIPATELGENPTYTSFAYTFTAAGSRTVLKFSDYQLLTSGSSATLLLDNIVLSPVLTGPVVDVSNPPTGAVSVAGRTSQNATLSVSNTISDADGMGAVSYQWQRSAGHGWSDITSANSTTYALTASDVGANIRVLASYTDGMGHNESMASNVTNRVGIPNALPTGSISLSGVAQQGQALIASNSIEDVDGMSGKLPAFSPAGNASMVNGSIYQLSPNSENMAGSVWRPVDLSKNLSVSAKLYFGASDAGADGVTFAFQNQTMNALGGTGSGVGISGISGAFGVKFDTYTGAGEPTSDFSQFFKNGNPTTGSNTSFDSFNQHSNLEDSKWHDIELFWDAASKTLSYTLDGVAIDTKTYDVVGTDWGGNSNGWFGFTAGTGGASNQQQVQITSVYQPLSYGATTYPTLRLSMAGFAVPDYAASFDSYSMLPTILTTATTTQKSGAAWGNLVDLSKNLSVRADVYFGSNDAGADGLTFALQNRGSGVVGTAGSGLGISGIASAFGVKFDTYAGNGEPNSDFSQFFKNGNVNTGADTAFDGFHLHSNIENGQWHSVIFTWDAASKTLSYSLDNTNIASRTYDVVANDWGGNSMGWFGFTAGTGAASNTQSVKNIVLQQTDPQQSSSGPFLIAGNAGDGNPSFAIGTALAPRVVLTPAQTSQAGSTWASVDLSKNLTVKAKLFFGSNGNSDADGISFSLQNNGASVVGGTGSQMGIGGISSAFGVKFDTWGNAGEPTTDFAQFFKNGNSSTGSNTSFDSFHSLTLANGNLSDGLFHDVILTWDAGNKTLSYTLDGINVASKTYDVVTNDWGGNTNAWLGFTAGTGGAPTTQLVQILSIQQIAYQWQSSSDGLNWADISNAIGNSFTPTIDQAGLALRVVGSYLDDKGSLESVVSLPAYGQTQNIVQNGSFEAASATGLNIVPTSWSKEHDNVGTMENGIRSTDGNRALLFHGWNTATSAAISQTLTTIEGQTYVLSFDMGSGDQSVMANDQLRVEVISGQRVVLDVTAVDTTAVKATTKGQEYGHYTYTFTATGTTTVLRFTDQSILSTTSSENMALDNVVVQALSPLAVNYSTNLPPTVAHFMDNQHFQLGTPFTFALPAGTFSDGNPGDMLTYSATQIDGSALPAWISFDPLTGLFSGKKDLPAPSQNGANLTTSSNPALSIKVTATDPMTLSASTTFKLAFDQTVRMSISGMLDDRQSDGNDTLLASTLVVGNNLIYGGNGSDQIIGGNQNDTIIGGKGNDLLFGGPGSDTYVFNLGDGQDTISDVVFSNATQSDSNILNFKGSGIDHNKLWFTRSNDDLLIQIIGSNDRVTVQDWFNPHPAGLELLDVYRWSLDKIESFDTNATKFVLTTASVDNLVNAMAGFSIPSSGTVLSNYAALTTAETTNWIATPI